MASHRYIGYVGRLAVAVGVGAAAIAATPGTAYAETGTSTDSSSTEASESRGSQDTGPDTNADRDEKPTDSADSGESDDAAESDESDEEAGSEESAKKDAEPSLATKLRKSAEQFEAEQVERLRAMLTPQAAAAKKEPAPERDSTEQVEPAPAAEAKTPDESEDTDREAVAAAEPVTSAAEPWRPDPFRPDDPDPDDVPTAVLALRDAILRAPIDPRLKPVIREGVELAYRISQVAPVTNVPVPAYKIIPALFEAARGDKARSQLIVNQLLLTTQPIALLYYGYDQIADLLNLEYEARELKEEFYRTAWDTVDPLALLHVRGRHGLGNSVLPR